MASVPPRLLLGTIALSLAGPACDVAASQRAFQPGARAEPRAARAYPAWAEVLAAPAAEPAAPPDDDLVGDDLDRPMGAEAGMVIPSACGACGCLNPEAY